MSSLPSGIRLMSLLREHLDEIMGRERTNLTSIHLYCTGLYWVAFERSAYQLYRAFPDSEIMPMRLYAYPFPIVMVSVTDRLLRSYARKHILKMLLLLLLCGLLISVFLGMVIIPRILVISHKKRLYDIPDSRKIHTTHVPRLGSLSFFPVILIFAWTR